MERFTKETCHTLREDVIAALAAVAAKHGVKVSPSGGTFTEATLDMRLHWEVQATGTLQAQWNQNCEMYGLKPEHFNALVSFGGHTYKVLGLRTRRTKFPIAAEDVATKKMTLLMPSTVARLAVPATTPGRVQLKKP